MLLEANFSRESVNSWCNEVLPFMKFKGINRMNIPKEAFGVTEIRIKTGRPVLFGNHYQEWLLLADGTVENLELRNKIVPYTVTGEDIEKILNIISQNSIYAFQESISNGFITLKGGHRVGIVGKAIVEKGKIVNLSEFSSMNFRICREVKGSAKKAIKYIRKGSSVLNTLIISPPGCGKTTVLRDIARTLSDGEEVNRMKGLRIGIVDERSEIAASIKGIPQLDVGLRSDVLDSCPKAHGINMLLRSMSPQVIITDEIGSENDLYAIRKSINSGVKIITTFHGDISFKGKIREQVRSFIKCGIFDRILSISSENGPGTLEEVYDVNEQNIIYKRCDDV